MRLGTISQELAAFAAVAVLAAAGASAAAQASDGLVAAARAGSLARVESALAAGAPVVDEAMVGAATNIGRSRARRDILARLLERGGNPNARVASRGDVLTPLLLAAMGGSPDAVRLLLDAGADPNLAGRMLGGDLTPLGATLLGDRVDIARMLVAAGADPGAPAFHGQSAASMATSPGKTAFAAALTQAGADPNARGVAGARPLHAAAREGDLKALRTLLDQGADPNAADDAGETPLHAALEGAHVKAARALLAAGADVNARTKAGTTPLMSAASSGSGAAVQTALDAGADVDVRDADGRHAASYAKGVDDALDRIAAASPEMRKNRAAPRVEQSGEYPAGAVSAPCGEHGSHRLPPDAAVCGASGSYSLVVSFVREGGVEVGTIAPPLCAPVALQGGHDYRIGVMEASYDWAWECQPFVRFTSGERTKRAVLHKTNQHGGQREIVVKATASRAAPRAPEPPARLRVVLVDDPDGGKFAFDGSEKGVLEVRVRAETTGDIDPDAIEWTMTKIGESKMTVDPPKGSEVTIRFEGMPGWTGNFGPKTITAAAGAHRDSVQVRVFFDPRAKNHPQATGPSRFRGTPNWFYYWEQTSAGGVFEPRYDAARRSCTGAPIVGQYVFAADAIYLTDAVVDGVCVARPDGSRARAFDCYAETLRHEDVHNVEFHKWYTPFPFGPIECMGAYGKNDAGTLAANLGKLLAADTDRDLVPNYVETALAASRGCSPLVAKSCSGRPAHLDVGDAEMNAYTVGWKAWPLCSSKAEDWSKGGQQWDPGACAGR